MKFEITTNVNGEKIAYFPKLGFSKKIISDDFGNEYFEIFNPYMEKETSIIKYSLFAGQEDIAIKAVRDGFADALLQKKNIFLGQSSLSPVKFINEKYGEQIRKTTIEGWKNAAWKYYIKLSSSSMSSGLPITKENKLTFLNESEYLLFDTRDQANQYIDKLQQEFEVIMNAEKPLENEENMEKFFDKHKNSVFSEMLFAKTRNVNEVFTIYTKLCK